MQVIFKILQFTSFWWKKLFPYVMSTIENPSMVDLMLYQMRSYTILYPNGVWEVKNPYFDKSAEVLYLSRS